MYQRSKFGRLLYVAPYFVRFSFVERVQSSLPYVEGDQKGIGEYFDTIRCYQLRRLRYLPDQLCFMEKQLTKRAEYGKNHFNNS